jgi:hypothetical protein
MLEKNTVLTIMELSLAVEKCKQETKTALDLIFENLNHGQTQKLLKHQEIKELVDRYGVQTN